MAERGPRTSGADVSAELFRGTLAAHASGVVIVTAPSQGGPVGITATSFTSLSLAPPLVSFAIGARSTTWPAIRDAPGFAVNVLAEHQSAVAARFASRGVDRFGTPTRWHTGPDGLPLLAEAAAHVLCERHEVLAVGDHWLVVGRVVGAAATGGAAPLLYHRGRYGRFDEET